MKFEIALFLGTASAVTLRQADAPAPGGDPIFGYAFAGTYSSTNAGFVQLQSEDAPAPGGDPIFGYAFAGTYSPTNAGFVQLEQGSACANAGVPGVTCAIHNEQLWAEGMKGDENLSEQITMKNDYDLGKYKLLQTENMK